MYNYIEYLPKYLRAIKEFKALDSAINPQTDMLFRKAEQVYKNQFLNSADLKTIKRWEGIYNIISLKTFSLDNRRLKLILKQSQKIPYTFNMLEDYLSQLFAHASASVDYDHYQINVDILMENDTQVDNLYASLRQMLPANMLIHTELRTKIAAQTYIAASMTSYSEETMNSGFFTVLPAYPVKLGGSITGHSTESMNERFETMLPGTIVSGSGMTNYTKEAIS